MIILVGILFERMPRKSKAQRISAASYDVQLFASAEADKRFEENVVHKAIIPQSGFFLPSNMWFRTYTKPIKTR